MNWLDDHVRSLIHNGSSEQEMARHARSSGQNIRDGARDQYRPEKDLREFKEVS